MNNIAYCGFNCDYCPICIDTKNNNLEGLRKTLNNPNGTIEELGCLGCKSKMINKMCNECNIKKCNLRKNIDSCSKCNDFPCSYLNENISELSMKTLKRLREEWNEKR